MRKVMLMALLPLAGAAQAETVSELWRLGEFASPESAYYDAGSDMIIVSNIGVFGPDGGMDGRLSTVAPDGTLIAANWVEGLMDPKGMASRDGKLYVADAIGLHVVDIASGTLEATIPLEGGMFPNDVTIGPDGTVYVSDFFGGGIFQIRDGAASLLMAQGSLPLPNGLLVIGDQMIVGSFGDALGENFQVNNPGGLLSVALDSGEITALEGAQGVGSVDGIAEIDGLILYSDNPTGKIFGWRDGVNTMLIEAGSGAADMGAMGSTILVPNLNTGEVVAYSVSN